MIARVDTIVTLNALIIDDFSIVVPYFPTDIDPLRTASGTGAAPGTIGNSGNLGLKRIQIHQGSEDRRVRTKYSAKRSLTVKVSKNHTNHKKNKKDACSTHNHMEKRKVHYKIKRRFVTEIFVIITRKIDHRPQRLRAEI